MEILIIIAALAFEALLMWRNIQYGALAVFLVFSMIPISFGINLGIRLNIMTLSVALFFVFAFNQIRSNRTGATERNGLKWYCVYVFITSFVATMLSLYPGDFARNFIAFLVNFILMPLILSSIGFEGAQLHRIKKLLVLFYIAVGLYGILNYIVKINPYLLLMGAITNTDASSDFFMNEERGFLQGRVSSFYSSPLLLGQITVILFGYGLFAFKDAVRRWLHIPCLCLMALMCLLCGSRSALVPIVLVGLIYMGYTFKEKVVKYILLIPVILIIGYSMIPAQHKDSVKAFVFFWNDEYAQNVDIHGSSVGLRFNQFANGLNVIESNPILGLGQGYVSQHGADHPEMFGYESYVFQFLVDGGLLGVIAFTIFYFYLYLSLLRRSGLPYDRMRVHALCLSYYLNILFTGIMTGSFSIFMIFYFLLKAEIERNDIKKPFVINWGDYSFVIKVKWRSDDTQKDTLLLA